MTAWNEQTQNVDRAASAADRMQMELCCGNGALMLVQQGDLSVGEQYIILGLNIPNYPQE